MFKFFTDKKWRAWSIFGTIFVFASIFIQVQLDKQINFWARDFYDAIQKSVTEPGSVSTGDLYWYLVQFGLLAAPWVAIAVLREFFTSHWTFRWRKSMTTYYHDLYKDISDIEGVSQRVQEDTLKFARLVETLGTGLVHSLMTLAVFLPILASLSANVLIFPIFGEVHHGLMWLAFMAAIGGTLFLMWVGRKLPGIEFDIQKEEAGYRKYLVLHENDVIVDETNYADFKKQIELLFDRVRSIHYKMYFAYMMFGFWKWGYLQAMVILPYIALIPSIGLGLLTFGAIRQIVDAFQKVETSLQYVIRSWSLIVELISVWKRLSAFEKSIKNRKETA